MNKGHKWKAVIVSTDGPHGSLGRKALNCQIFIVSYLQFVERKRLYPALLNWVQIFNSGKKPHRQLSMRCIAKPLKNGSMRPS